MHDKYHEKIAIVYKPTWFLESYVIGTANCIYFLEPVNHPSRFKLQSHKTYYQVKRRKSIVLFR